jgi:hypothetical protein
MTVIRKIMNETDTTFAPRGVLGVLAFIVDRGGCNATDLQALLCDFGLATAATYDPEQHGDIPGIVTGDPIVAYAEPLKGALAVGRDLLGARYRVGKH